MQPTLCTRCKKHDAVVFVTGTENGGSADEGLCLKCAREMKLKPVEDVIRRMGFSDEELDNLFEF